MMTNKKLTPSKFRKLTSLKSKLDYNPTTGVFVDKKKQCVVGCINSAGYPVIKIGRYYTPCHQLAYFFKYGYIPSLIDHANHYRLDCRIKNLIRSTPSENNKNKTLSKNNTSGITGVVLIKNSIDKYNVTIGVDGKNKLIATNVYLNEATVLRKEAEVKYGYNDNHGKDRQKIILSSQLPIQNIDNLGWISVINYDYKKIIRYKNNTGTRTKSIKFFKFLGIHEQEESAINIYDREVIIRENFMFKLKKRQC